VTEGISYDAHRPGFAWQMYFKLYEVGQVITFSKPTYKYTSTTGLLLGLTSNINETCSVTNISYGFIINIIKTLLKT
jgi:hypothetical protein